MAEITLNLEDLSDAVLEAIIAREDAALADAATRELRKRREGTRVHNRVLTSSSGLYYIHSAREMDDGRIVNARYTRLTNTFGCLVQEQEQYSEFVATIGERAHWVGQ